MVLKKVIVVLSVGIMFVLSSCGEKNEARASQKNVASNPVTAIAETKTEPTSTTKADVTNSVVTMIEVGSLTCRPCKMMEAVLEQVRSTYGEKVKVIFHDINTSTGRAYAISAGVKAIPTQIFLDKSGKEYSRHMGYYPYAEVEKQLKLKLN